MLLILQWVSESPGVFVKHGLLGPISRVPDSVSLGWGLRICISDTCPGDADTADLAATLSYPPLYGFSITSLTFGR